MFKFLKICPEFSWKSQNKNELDQLTWRTNISSDVVILEKSLRTKFLKWHLLYEMYVNASTDNSYSLSSISDPLSVSDTPWLSTTCQINFPIVNMPLICSANEKVGYSYSTNSYIAFKKQIVVYIYLHVTTRIIPKITNFPKWLYITFHCFVILINIMLGSRWCGPKLYFQL